MLQMEPGWGAGIIDQVEAAGRDSMHQVIGDVTVAGVLVVPYFQV